MRKISDPINFNLLLMRKDMRSEILISFPISQKLKTTTTEEKDQIIICPQRQPTKKVDSEDG